MAVAFIAGPSPVAEHGLEDTQASSRGSRTPELRLSSAMVHGPAAPRHVEPSNSDRTGWPPVPQGQILNQDHQGSPKSYYYSRLSDKKMDTQTT